MVSANCQEACSDGKEVAEDGSHGEEEAHPGHDIGKGAANDECCATSPPVAVKGHCVVYTADRVRFEVPLAYLSTAVFSELLAMSQEEFGFAGGDDGRIMLPCDAAVMEYALCLLRRDASREIVRAFMSSVARPCSNFDGGATAPCSGLGHQVAAC